MSRKFLFNDIRAFDPRDIRGLTLWLDYRNGVYTDTAMTTPATVGQTVKGWADRSGNGYHATEATNPPTLAADGLAFDGVNDVLRVARMTGQFGGGFGYFVVASLVDGQPSSTRRLFGGRDSSPIREYFDLQLSAAGLLIVAVNQSGTSRSTTINTFADGQSSSFIASGVADPSGNLTGYFNAVSAGTPAVLSTLTWADIAGGDAETIAIGALLSDASTVGTFCACTIKSLLIYNRPLTATELSQVHRYIGNTHGITVP